MTSTARTIGRSIALSFVLGFILNASSSLAARQTNEFAKGEKTGTEEKGKKKDEKEPKPTDQKPKH